MASVGAEVRDCLCLHSRQAARHLTQIYDHALRTSGLRVTQFQLLAAIDETEPVIQQTLSNLMGMDRTTLTRNLALLQGEGLVDMRPGLNDRRERSYRLTKAGRQAVAKALPLWRSAQQELTAQLLAGRRKVSAKTAIRTLEELSQVGGEPPK